jgi:hypothetical protein
VSIGTSEGSRKGKIKVDHGEGAVRRYDVFCRRGKIVLGEDCRWSNLMNTVGLLAKLRVLAIWQTKIDRLQSMSLVIR